MLHDLRFAFRSLAKSPGFVIAVLLTLGLGIGINTSTFSILNSLMFRPLPYPEAGQLVRLTCTNPQDTADNFSPANYLDLKRQATAFSELTLAGPTLANLAAPGQPAEQVWAASATGDYFKMLRTPPLLGRAFTAEDEHDGKDQVLILSYPCWMRRYNGDPAVLGRILRLDGRPMTVIGVMPPRFDDILIWGPADCWRPQVLDNGTSTVRDKAWLTVYARLNSGVPLATAQAQVDTIAANLGRDFPKQNRGLRMQVTSMDQGRRGAGAAGEWLIMGLAVSVLLIACANLANLQLARTLQFERDHAVRLALGASRWRLVRHLLAECLLLALAGCPLGVLVAVWSNDLISSHIPLIPGQGLPLPVDIRVLGFALGIAVLTGVAFGLLPALLAAGTDVNRALKLGSANSSGDRSRHRLRDGLIIIEITLSLTLMVCAGFFVRGLDRLNHRELGWQPDHLIFGAVTLPWNKYGTDDSCRIFAQKLERELATIPGVSHFALTNFSPLYDSPLEYFTYEPAAPGGNPDKQAAALVQADPGAFATLGMTLRRGRDFTPDDRKDSPAVVIINESMARTLWPGQDALGRRIQTLDTGQVAWREVVGVVSDRNSAFIGAPPQPFQIYRPLAQVPQHWPIILARSTGNPAALEHDLRVAVQRIDPDLAVVNLVTGRAGLETVGASFVTINFVISLFALFGVMLAVLGLYSVIARLVLQRTREIGVRLALGAQPQDVLQLVLRRGLRLVLIGLTLGIAAALGALKLCTAIVAGYPGVDWVWFAGAVVALFAATLLACWLPARRATRVDPIVALRSE